MLKLLDAANKIEWQEPVLRRRYESPAEAFESREGGWLPNGAALSSGSQTARDVEYRQQCRISGNMTEADLVRDVIQGGSVELRDFPDGTMWFFREP